MSPANDRPSSLLAAPRAMKVEALSIRVVGVRTGLASEKPRVLRPAYSLSIAAAGEGSFSLEPAGC